MLELFYLFAAIVALMVLFGVAYRSTGGTDLPEEPDRRLDRLATMLDPEVMETIIQRARIEGVSEVAMLNRLLREGIRQGAHPPDPESPPRS